MINDITDIDVLKGQLVGASERIPDKKSPKEILHKYLSYIPLVISFLVVFYGLTFLYLRYKAPIYQSSIKILVTDDSKKSGKDLSTAILDQIVSNGKSNIANELEIVKSRTLMERVVNVLQLNVVYHSLGKVRTTELYDTLRNNFISFSSIKDSSRKYSVDIRILNGKIFYIHQKREDLIYNHTVVKTPDFDFTVHIRTLDAYRPDYIYTASWYSPLTMAEVLANQINAEALNKDASIMNVTLLSEIPLKGKRILNQLAIEYAKANVEDKNKAVDNTIRFIDDRLLLIADELGGVEVSMQKFRQENNVIDVSNQEQLEFDRVKNIRDKLDESDVKIRVADMVLSYVNDPSRKYSLVPSSLGIEDATLLSLIKSYNEQVTEREELLKTVAPGNIAVKTIEGQLEQLQQKIIESVSNVKKVYSSGYNQAKSDYNEILQTINKVPQKEKELLEISRQQGIKEKLYVYLLEKREESALTKASAVANSTRIDSAVTSGVPVTPKSTLMYVFATILGLAIPISIIYLRDLFNDKITTREDIIKYTKAPIIGEINHSNIKERKIIADKSRGVVSEQFRLIRTNLQYFLSKENASNVVLVTSTMANEGKSFVSMNLGAVLANANKKVALLEFDLRKPKIKSALDMQTNGLGITSYLVDNNLTIKDITNPILNLANLYLVPAGPVPPNPAELLLSQRMDTLITSLKKEFDYIIIDTSPIGLVSDAKVLATYSDVVFYIIRQRYTYKKQIEFLDDLYRQRAIKNTALIINDITTNGAKGYYGYGAGYGYGYSLSYNYDYGYSYGKESEKEKPWWRKIISIFKRKD